MGSPGPRTSDWYRTSPRLPGRFQNPSCFRGYGQPQPHPLYRTTNQAYGSKAPTVHEVPTSFHITSHAFSNTLGQCGMYSDNGLNTALEKSRDTAQPTSSPPMTTSTFTPATTQVARRTVRCALVTVTA